MSKSPSAKAADLALTAPPKTPIARYVMEAVKDVSAPYLFNHCLRTYAFAELLGRHDNLTYDSETLFCACLMHDLGITSKYRGKLRFEVDGADAAYKLLTTNGASTKVAQTVWDAIALHATLHIPMRKGSEIALTHQGAAADVLGARLADLAPSAVKRILEEYPRQNFKQNIINDLVDYLRHNRQGGAGYWMADIATKYLAVPNPSMDIAIHAAAFDQ
jgi:HD superfamily phosphodiesterase